MRAIGIFGGTFDPVHLGHIQMALEAKKSLALDEVRLLPCHQPPHRDTPQLSSEQRLHLLQLATAGIEGLLIDGRELKRDKPSWTVDTLEDLRSEYGADISMTLLMGADAFSGLTNWHRWQELPKLAHIAVLQRPEYELPDAGVLSQWLAGSTGSNRVGAINNAEKVERIHQQASGIVIAISQPEIDLSATGIRRQLSAGILPDGLAPVVQDYIVSHQLYGFSKGVGKSTNTMKEKIVNGS